MRAILTMTKYRFDSYQEIADLQDVCDYVWGIDTCYGAEQSVTILTEDNIKDNDYYVEDDEKSEYGLYTDTGDDYTRIIHPIENTPLEDIFANKINEWLI